MKLVIQRVKQASVTVNAEVVGRIGPGMLILLGIAKGDGETQVNHLAEKVAGLRIFEDPDGKMNLSAAEVKAEFLIVSQFTLLGDCAKGRRPSFEKAADPKTAETLYNFFVAKLRQQNFKVETGRFQAIMEVSLVNDGPVTFVLDTE